MRNVVVWNVRDARGLNQDEKALLWAIESRGHCEGTWRRLAADAGDMSKDRFYRARNSLLAKSLIRVVRKYNDVSEYAVHAEALSGYVPDSHSQNGEANGSDSANGHSHSANQDSHMTETKKNTKKNGKKNVTSKKNTTAPVVAEATTVTVDDASSLPKEESVPSMGTIWVSETGDVLFESDTGSGVYMLSECGVSALPLPETRTAAPVVDEFPPERVEKIRAEVATHVGPQSWDDWPQAVSDAVLALVLDPKFAPLNRDELRIKKAHDRVSRDMTLRRM